MMHQGIEIQVKQALEEDVGSGDITGSLIPKDLMGKAKLFSREPAVVCGQEWFEEVFKQISNKIQIKWLVRLISNCSFLFSILFLYFFANK